MNPHRYAVRRPTTSRGSMMASELDSSGNRGRKRKRQRVSFAAGELLEEVKLFHMAKPVNSSIPPPAVDDAGEEDAASQPGLALLGLFGVESPSPSAAASSASPSPSPSTLASPSTTSHVAVGTTAPNGGSQFRSAAASTQQTSEGQGGGGGGGSSFSSGGDSAGVDSAGTGRVAGGSKLFKGFEKTETVVRRKKQVVPPPPPPGTPPPLPPPDEGAHLAHRYPKDIWPGHKPPNHTAEVREANGVGGKGAEEEHLEFFCDGCDETIPSGVERMECAVCPDEFCLCHGCYDEGEVLDKRHKHELLPSAAPFHVTRAATSAEAALEAAKALHVTEAQDGEGLPYDDSDLG